MIKFYLAGISILIVFALLAFLLIDSINKIYNLFKMREKKDE